MTTPSPEDRRRFGRIHFDVPMPARVGDARVQILDIAMTGARVASEARFTPNARLDLKFDWEGRHVVAACSVVRCTLYAFAKSPGDKSVYQTGLHFENIVAESDVVMREMIATHVLNALEEQKANARGIPPVGPYVHMEGKSDLFRRCEMVDGKWRRSQTPRPEQPSSGFTISAEVGLKYVDLLCETYQRADEEGRRLTRILAQLSISKVEGIPTRRYLP